MMRKIAALAAFIVFSLPMLAPTQVHAQQGDHLIISNLTVPNRNRLKAGDPYRASVNIRTTGGATVKIHEMCFFWNQEGPICFDNWNMQDTGDGGVMPVILLSTGNPGRYTLTALLRYTYQGQSFYTNQEQIRIRVR